MTVTTRDQFVAVAARLFAEKGFYGTSIAAIANELGLTKQALLHHFGSKEKLYAEVLQAISGELISATGQILANGEAPARQLEDLVLTQYRLQMSDPDAARLIMRELLDNEQRAQKVGNWFLKPYLEALVDKVLSIEHLSDVSEPRALALVYQFLGAAHYFAVSQPTLGMIFGDATIAGANQVYEQELRALIRARLADH